jgi:pyruvate dehydrogenase E2 component (dihydrolipoamide acetyltransferase)
MPIDVLMPQLSPTMTEGRLASWVKKEGETVATGDVIAEVETDKATMEIEATADGTIHSIIGKTGEDIQVGTPIAVLAEEGEKVAKDYKPKAAKVTKAEAVEEEEKVQVNETKSAAAPTVVQATTNPLPQPTASVAASVKSPSHGGEVLASPVAKRLAKKLGVNLVNIVGSGPKGRIVEKDVRQASTGFGGGGTPTRYSDETVRHTPMRKSIAARLTTAKQFVPHFYLTASAKVDSLLEAREQLNNAAPEEEGLHYKISVNDMIIKACAMALKKNPDANVAWGNDELVKFGNVDISVAVSIDGGLITPILQNADQKNVIQISNEMKELASLARAGKLDPEQYEGGSFTVSNLGMYGVKEFKAIINPPQGAILAVGGAEERVISENGEIGVASVMDISLSVDHRAIDGALGAELLRDIKFYLENPVAMMV